MAEKKHEEKKSPPKAEKEGTKMASPQTEAVAKQLEVKELKQKQNVLNLDNLEDSEIEVVTKKYIVPKGMSVDEAMEAIFSIVTPKEKQLQALLKFAESESYQASKAAAMSGGNYLTPQLRTKIVNTLSNIDAFAEMSAKDIFGRWLTGYKEGKPSAKKLLDQVRALEEFADL